MADPSYNAGAKVRGYLGTQAPAARRQAVGAILPGGMYSADLIGAAAPTVSSFIQGLLGVQPAKASPAAAAIAAAPAPAPVKSASNSQNSAFSPARNNANPGFAELAAQFAAANGGKISLHQLSALSDIAYKTSPRQSIRNPTYKDIVGGELLSRSQELLAAEQNKALEMIAAGDKKGGEDYGKAAVSRYIGNLQQIMGADPLEQAYADRIAALQQEE